jgi:hypothetical protein
MKHKVYIELIEGTWCVMYVPHSSSPVCPKVIANKPGDWTRGRVEQWVKLQSDLELTEVVRPLSGNRRK